MYSLLYLKVFLVIFGTVFVNMSQIIKYEIIVLNYT